MSPIRGQIGDPVTVERTDLDGKSEINRIDVEGDPEDIDKFLGFLRELGVLNKIATIRVRGTRDVLELYGDNHPSR